MGVGDRAGDQSRLELRIVDDTQDRLAPLTTDRRAQALRPVLLRASDRVVGEIKDRLGAAIVLTQFKALSSREALVEAQDILDLRATKTIDALCIVTDGEDMRAL